MKTKSKTIWGVQCPECEERMFSFHVHDYKTCGCSNNTIVDGGRDYLRYGCGQGKQMPKRIKWSVKKDGKYPVVKYKDTFPY